MIENLAKRFRKSSSNWGKGFIYINELMNKIGMKKPLYSYEAHLPIRINKQKFLEVISLPEVQEFMKTSKVLHKRTLYKNYDKPKKIIELRKDVKVTLKKDDSGELLKICGWLSTADGVIGNSKFYNMNYLLRSKLGTPCIYEGVNQTKEKTAKEKNKKTTNLPYKTNRYF